MKVVRNVDELVDAFRKAWGPELKPDNDVSYARRLWYVLPGIAQVAGAVGAWLDLCEEFERGVFGIGETEMAMIAAARAELAGEWVVETWLRGSKVCIEINGEESEDLSLTTVHALLKDGQVGNGIRYAIRPLLPFAPAPEPRRVRPILYDCSGSKELLCPCGSGGQSLTTYNCQHCGAEFDLPAIPAAEALGKAVGDA